jgi:type II secretory pathway component PulF
MASEHEEQRIGERLLRQEGAGTGGAADGTGATAQATAALKRYQRRTMWLAGTVASLWVLAVALAVGLYWGFVVFALPRIDEVINQGSPDGSNMFRLLAQWGNLMVWTSAALVLLAAAAGTVLFVLAVRQLTLRQIRASLAEISEQLRRLEQRGGEAANR